MAGLTVLLPNLPSPPKTELISGRLQRAEQARKLMVPDARLQPAPLKEDTRTTDSEEAF